MAQNVTKSKELLKKGSKSEGQQEKYNEAHHQKFSFQAEMYLFKPSDGKTSNKIRFRFEKMPQFNPLALNLKYSIS